ncbi:MAG: hypothetical protein WC634_02360 [archaeon]
MRPWRKPPIAAESRLPEHELLQRLITRNSKIACIGGHGSPEDDPTPAFLAQATRSKAVTLVDCQDLALLDRLKRIQPRGKFPKKLGQKIAGLTKGSGLKTGYGGLIKYREEMQGTQKKAIIGLKTGIRLQPGLAWKTGIKPGTLNLIVDRDVNYWVSIQGKTKLQETINHYLSLLKKGGKIALLFNTTRDGAEEHLRATKEIIQGLLPKQKATVEEIPIKTEKFNLGPKQIQPRYSMQLAIIVTKL